MNHLEIGVPVPVRRRGAETGRNEDAVDRPVHLLQRHDEKLVGPIVEAELFGSGHRPIRTLSRLRAKRFLMLEPVTPAPKRSSSETTPAAVGLDAIGKAPRQHQRGRPRLSSQQGQALGHGDEHCGGEPDGYGRQVDRCQRPDPHRRVQKCESHRVGRRSDARVSPRSRNRLTKFAHGSLQGQPCCGLGGAGRREHASDIKLCSNLNTVSLRSRACWTSATGET